MDEAAVRKMIREEIRGFVGTLVEIFTKPHGMNEDGDAYDGPSNPKGHYRYHPSIDRVVAARLRRFAEGKDWL